MQDALSGRSKAISRIAEVFREHGYEGTSLATLTLATGLGKGSLYNFFPGGKEEMAAAVLADIEAWFEENIFAPLLQPDDGSDAISRMFDGVVDYFGSGERICLQGAFALAHERDRFESAVQQYFERWIDALTIALRRSDRTDARARADATDTVVRIQGALVLARALNRPAVFLEVVERPRAGL